MLTWTHIGDDIYQSGCGTFIINLNGGTRWPEPVTLQRTDGQPLRTWSGWWPFLCCENKGVAERLAESQGTQFVPMGAYPVYGPIHVLSPRRDWAATNGRITG